MWQQIENLIKLSQNEIFGLALENQPGNPERRNYYRFLYYLCQWLKPYTVLEIGVETGMASAYMCAGQRGHGGQVIGIDINAQPIFGDNYHFINGDSTQTATWTKVGSIVHDFGRIGIVYQDSSHHYEASKKEWELYTQYLNHPALWICDDITPAFHDPLIDPPGLGMVQYFDGLPGDKRKFENVLHYGNIWGIIHVK